MNRIQTLLNSFNLETNLKAYFGDQFDFNNPYYPAGMYRIQDNYKNAPMNRLDYGNVLVIHTKGYDTLAMIVFPYNSDVPVIYRVGNFTSFPTNKWCKINAEVI